MSELKALAHRTATQVGEAFVAAYRLGQADLQAEFDTLVTRYDEAVGEWKLTADEGGDMARATEECETQLISLAHDFARLAGREET